MQYRRFSHELFLVLMGTICLALLSYNNNLLAEEQSQPQENVTSFNQDYFAQYQAVTLRDMIRLIPGGVNILNGLNNNQQSRGLGSSGAQVLIDGKRMSGKSNDMSTRLSRIQASQVERIELIRGTAEGLDIRSQGILINVVLKHSDGLAQTYLAEFTLVHDIAQKIEPEILLSTNGQIDNIEYGISLNQDNFMRSWDDLEDLMDANRNIDEIRDLNRERLWVKQSIDMNLQVNFDSGDILRLNGLYDIVNLDDDGLEEQFSFATGQLLAIEERIQRRDEKEWEFGGDYTTELGDLGTWKTVFISTREAGDSTFILNEDVDGVVEREFTFDEDNVESERILRTNLSSEIFSDQTIEVGAEAAFNKLSAYQSSDFGDYEFSEITEDRYDFFVTHSMSLGETISLQSALTREESTIEQDTIGIQDSRDFSFWKPRLELRYDLNEQNQLRFIVDKVVSQLDLDNFIAERNDDDDTIDLGNPDLVPEKVLKYSIAFEHRFNDDLGTIEVELFRDDITDFISKTRLADGGTGTGNIGDAYRQGVNLELSTKLDMLGIDNALINFNYRYRDTEILDPFLNTRRVMNRIPEHYYRLDFRHDLPEYGIVYGIDAQYRSNQFRQDVALFEKRVDLFDVRSVYVEYSLSDTLRLRFDVRHPTNEKRRFDKTFYEDDIATGDIDRIEYRRSEILPTYSLKLQATF